MGDEMDDYAIDPLTVTPSPTSDRLEANLANIPVKPHPDELKELEEEYAREELGSRPF